ncbi:MAG: phosphoribosylamine--glycine ligase [Dehalococcoidia bacterium]|nr:phosphoribosylamine--glycine ligase [Chloroflexota bacterium]MCK4242851.1 phosphoribosylamine--glycine ligase [Dehalococcoidia bacterium]
MRILVIGGGAREHTLVWKLNQSPNVKEIYVAPGNAGTGLIAQNLDIGATDLETLAQAAEGKNIELTVVGPEVPLAQGIVDLFHSRRIPCFGPTREATKIESSKVFAKELMHKYGIPCAQSRSFSSFDEARAYLQRQQPPIVVKADGLAAGKGSIVAQSQEEALEALSEIMEKRIFGAAGDQVLIEECLEGNEVSLLAFTDGKTVIPMVPACDYKRAFDGDQGPNTGGMGSYSPPKFFDEVMTNRVKDTILEPTVEAMAKEGKPFKGVLYAGLIMTLEGPKALEFNARFGDPENQVMIPRLKSDLLEVMLAVIDGTLDRTKVEWSNEACVGVVMASGGYPGSYTTGFPIEGCDEVDNDILVFHAGTKAKGGTIYTDGGRVLTVAAMGKTIAEARSRVYLNLPRIRFEGCHYRTDIAAREQS